MQLLAEELSVEHECYASPLNRYLPSYCSAFQDADRYFGSRGSFFNFAPRDGCYEVNPPFDKSSVVACFDRIRELLTAVNTSDHGLCFVVVINDQDRKHGETERAYQAVTPFLYRKIPVERGKHEYLMGLQHRRTGPGEHWSPTMASQILFFANGAGRRFYAVSGELERRLVAAFNTREVANKKSDEM